MPSPTITSPTLAPSTTGGSLLAEFVRAGREVAAHARVGIRALRSGAVAAIVISALWVLGIGGDAATTVLMMRTGLFEEANGAAASLMSVFGVGGWVVLSALMCVGFASLTLARPRSPYAATAATVALLVCLVKIYTAASNALLWWSVSA